MGYITPTTANKEVALTIVSHHLCPYVQRAVIALSEKSVPFSRLDVDLSNKPDWFTALSPLGKVPLLALGSVDTRKAGALQNKNEVVFESAVILEYLEETTPHPLHRASPLERARDRSWIEFGSAILNAIGRFYNAKTKGDFDKEALDMAAMFTRVEGELGEGPWFRGQEFGLVDAVYGPIFRYFDVFDQIGDFGVFAGLVKTVAWRQALSERPSVRGAVGADYNARLLDFLTRRASYISRLIA